MATEVMDDVGEVVPQARKHQAEKTGKRTQDDTRLKDLWPEPDWTQLIAGGLDSEVAARLCMLYDGLMRKPHCAMWGLSDAEWRDAYIKAIETLQRLAAHTHSLEDFDTLQERMLEALGLKGIDVRTAQMSVLAPAYAAGKGGSRHLDGNTAMSVKQQAMSKWLVKLGWPENTSVKDAALFPLKMKDGTWRAAHADAKGYTWDSVVILTEADAIRAIHTQIAEKQQSRNKESSSLPKKPTPDGVVRTGTDWRAGNNTTPEMLMDEFGLRAVQFGNFVGQGERQVWMNELFDAMADLSDLLGMRRKWIGFDGTLALSIGARGQGLSSNAAHYERHLKVMNLTKAHGAGSFAHEWGHALDHRLASMVYRVLSGGQPLEEAHVHYATELVGMLKDSHHLAEAGDKTSQISLALLNLSVAYGHDTEYYRRSRSIDYLPRSGRYWTNQWELFARGFEAFVQDAISAAGRQSPWLVHGTLESDYAGSFACPYPTGQERARLGTAFRELFGVLVAKPVAAQG